MNIEKSDCVEIIKGLALIRSNNIALWKFAHYSVEIERMNEEIKLVTELAYKLNEEYYAISFNKMEELFGKR